jgi:hypothetical protein
MGRDQEINREPALRFEHNFWPVPEIFRKPSMRSLNRPRWEVARVVPQWRTISYRTHVAAISPALLYVLPGLLTAPMVKGVLGSKNIEFAQISQRVLRTRQILVGLSVATSGRLAARQKASRFAG